MVKFIWLYFLAPRIVYRILYIFKIHDNWHLFKRRLIALTVQWAKTVPWFCYWTLSLVCSYCRLVNGCNTISGVVEQVPQCNFFFCKQFFQFASFSWILFLFFIPTEILVAKRFFSRLFFQLFLLSSFV